MVGLKSQEYMLSIYLFIIQRKKELKYFENMYNNISINLNHWVCNTQNKDYISRIWWKNTLHDTQNYYIFSKNYWQYIVRKSNKSFLQYIQ